MYNHKTILITGGTGTFGHNFTRFLLSNYKPKKVIIFSRDEFKQFRMQEEFARYENIRFFLGDIRDLSRLQRAFQGVDIVVHAAALKQVPTLEYNPFEAIQTNIIGSQNVINASLDQDVSKVLFISSDKAAHPVNLYGATKMCAEKLFVSSNVYNTGENKNGTAFSAVRYGNVIGSRGSIVETIANNIGKPLSLTHKDMTRFLITLDQCFNLVTFSIEKMVGGEIFVPKIPSMKMTDLFDALAPRSTVKITGIRPGEKIHEILVTQEEARNTFDLGKYYVILPPLAIKSEIYSKYIQYTHLVDKQFVYSSNTNSEWLDVEIIKKMMLKDDPIRPAKHNKK